MKTVRKVANIVLGLSDYGKNKDNKIKLLQEQLDYFREYTDICSLKKIDGYSRKKQLENIEFAKDVFELLKPLNISPFLIAGSLIGAVRHKGFIPWDDDLDYGVTRSDYFRIIDFFQQRDAVVVSTDDYKNYTNNVHLTRMDAELKSHPNTFFLDIFYNQIQINYGTNILDRKSLDIFPFDFFVDGYSFNEHKSYLKNIHSKLVESKSIEEYVYFIAKEVRSNPNISLEETENMYFGIESSMGYDRMNAIDHWIASTDFFPLKTIQFENNLFNSPKKAEMICELSYGDIMKYPKDVGIQSHCEYIEKYIYHNYPTVEFYLVDAFEIYHFIPLYKAFNSMGIYAKFIAEPSTYNVSGAWFDFDDAIEILKKNRLNYSKNINLNATMAFTTQRASELLKYSETTRKVRMCYGCSLLRKMFSEGEKFDYFLTPGRMMADCYINTKTKAQINIIGYPKYQYYDESEYLVGRKQIEQEILAKNIKKLPVLLYLPTWGENSSIQEYAEELNLLRDDFFVVAKAHHCTWRLESEYNNLTKLRQCVDFLCEGNADFYHLVKIADFAICDATSNSSTEVPLINSQIGMIIINPKQFDMDEYIPAVREFAELINDARIIVDKVKTVFKNDEHLKKRLEMIRYMYSTSNGLIENFGEEIKKIFYKNK